MNLYKKIIKIFMGISIPASKSEDIRQIPRILEFVTLDGLQRLIGVTAEKSLLFMVKELVDNALDKVGVEAIIIRIKSSSNSLTLSIIDEGNGEGYKTFTRESIEKILDFTKAPSSKRGWKKVSRGVLGNALQCCIGLSYALWDDDNRPMYTAEIIGDKRYLIGLRPNSERVEYYIHEEEHASINNNNSNDYEDDYEDYNKPTTTTTTTISFRLPLLNYEYEEFYNLVKFMALLNPHVRIYYEINGTRYRPNLIRKDVAIRDRTYIHWYSLKEFKDLVDNFKDYTVGMFVNRFSGFKNRSYVKMVFDEVGIEAGQRLYELDEEEKVNRLYEAMKRISKPINPRQLPTLGKDYFYSIGAYKYACRYGTYNGEDNDEDEDDNNKVIPYAIEVASFPSNSNNNVAYAFGLGPNYSIRFNGSGKIFEAINFTASLGEPFSGYTYYNTKIRGKRGVRLKSLVNDMNLVIHLVCPNITWLEPAKGKLDTKPFIDDILMLTKIVCKRVSRDRIDKMQVIKDVNDILSKHPDLIFSIRQIYYQLISHYNYPNKHSLYNSMDKIMTWAREEGYIDADRIADFSRPEYENNTRHKTYEEKIRDDAEYIVKNFDLDRWYKQPVYIECWIEKEALSRIILPVCSKYKIRLVVTRGYSSYSQIKDAVDRFPEGKKVVILYLGDHDSTGIHIEENLIERLYEEIERSGKSVELEVKRVALTDDQARQYNLLPIPVKERSQHREKYVGEHGNDAWELDALDHHTLIRLLEDEIKSCFDRLVDKQAWKAREEEVERYRQLLHEMVSTLINGMDSKGKDR